MDTSIIDAIKSRLNLLDFVQQKTELKRKGSYWQGRSPFYEDQNPSFTVWESTQRWKDFGEDTGGDLFDFVMRAENLDFRQALEQLAQVAGIPLEQDPAALQSYQNQRADDELRALAADHYRTHLQQTPGAQQYLSDRGFNETTLNSGLVGFASGKLHQLVGSPENQRRAVELGLLGERRGRYYDAIPAGYIVYIHVSGRRIGYVSGRNIRQKEHRNQRGPKAPFWAVTNEREKLVIVEGQADALSYYQWGISAVARCGLDVPFEKQQLKPFKEVYFDIDGDGADSNGLRRLGELAPLGGVVSQLYEGVRRWRADEPGHDQRPKDANALLQTGLTADTVREGLEVSQPYLERLIEEAQTARNSRQAQQIQTIIRLYTKLDQYNKVKYGSYIIGALNMTRRDFSTLVKQAIQGEQEAMFEQGEQYKVINGWMVCETHQEGLQSHIGLLNGQLMIDELISRDNGTDEPEHQYALSGSLHNGQPLKTLYLPTEEFYGMRWLGKYPSLIPGAKRGTLDHLRAAIQYLSGDIPGRTIYEHLGWRKFGNHWAYLSGQGAIGLPDETTTVDISAGRLQTNMKRYQLPLTVDTPAELHPAIYASLRFWQLHSGGLAVSVPIWASVYLAVLSPFIKPDFGLWVYGETGSFKSVMAALVLSHLGQWQGLEGAKHLPSNFETTTNSIMLDAFMAKDSLLVVDDFAPGLTQKENNQRDEIASRIMRSFGNRAARGRLKRAGKFDKVFPPRCLALVTAEDLPDGRSIRARAVTVAVPALPPQGSAELAQIKAHFTTAQNEDSYLYPVAMAGFIRWISQNWAEVERLAPQLFEANRPQFDQHGDHARIAPNYAKLMTAIDLALLYFEQCGAISPERKEQLRGDALGGLLLCLQGHAKEVNQVDPCQIFIEVLLDKLDARQWYLAPKEEPNYTDLHHPQAKLCGYQDEMYIYLLTGFTDEIRVEYRRQTGKTLISRNQIYKQLASKGWLELNNNKSTRTVFVKNGHSPRVLYLLKHKIRPEEKTV